MVKNSKEVDDAIKLFNDPTWRLNNLYYVVNKQGVKVKFKFNWAQQQLYDNIWYCNIILKARQLGMSTFISILFLDRCLFNSNISAGIIAHTLEDSQQLFRRVKFAYDSLPEPLKEIKTAENDTANMLKFSNGSSLRVGTSLRSSTFQFLHISEFGKICAKFPDKAQEIITGSLNTVEKGQYVFIESTAEGRDGYFYDICKKAQNNKAKLSELDFKFHFFPWYGEPSYRLGSNLRVDEESKIYFDHLKSMGIDLDEQQMSWYIAKKETQKDDMRREFPSSPEEAWEVSNEGFYYAKYMTSARAEGRIGHVPYEEALDVHTAWDLGFNDAMSIWYFQIYKKEIRLIDYDEASDSLDYCIGLLKRKDYTYGKHIAPHDIVVHEMSDGITRQMKARKHGINFLAAKKGGVIPGIDEVRNIMARCWFDEKKCAKGIKALDNYKKEWDDRHGCWRSNPLHDWASHGADAMRTLATGLDFVIPKQDNSGHNPNDYMNRRFG